MINSINIFLSKNKALDVPMRDEHLFLHPRLLSSGALFLGINYQYSPHEEHYEGSYNIGVSER